MLVLIAYSALFGRNPQILLRQAIAARLRAVSRALRQKNEEGRERLMRSLEGGNAELLKTLGMIKLLRLQPPDTTARLRALLTLSYSLALTVSAFDTAASCLSMKLGTPASSAPPHWSSLGISRATAASTKAFSSALRNRYVGPSGRDWQMAELAAERAAAPASPLPRPRWARWKPAAM
jgi:hypothetical protein